MSATCHTKANGSQKNNKLIERDIPVTEAKIKRRKMQVIIDASNIMIIASIIAIVYIAIGLAWTITRQWLPQPPVYWNAIQIAAQLILWPISMIVYALQYGIRRFQNADPEDE
jgi:O-antigen/teichoic acid export membrane protein